MNTEIERYDQWIINASDSLGVLSTIEDAKNDVINVLEEKKLKISSKEITEILKEKEVRTRVSLVRHYPHKKGVDLDRYNQLIEKLALGHTNDEKLEFPTLSAKIPCYAHFDEVKPKELVYSLENILSQINTIVIFDDTEESSTRVKNSIKDLKSEKMRKKFPNLLFISDAIILPWSDKKKPFDEDLTTCAVTFWKLIKKIKDEFIKNGAVTQNIVIMWNRSYCQWFLNAQENEKISPYSAVKQLERDWFLYIEYNSEKWLVKNQNDKISITPKNYRDLLMIFPHIEHDSIIDFQNKLNVCFIKWIYRYDTFLVSDNPDLRTFCLANLIKNKEYSSIEKYYLSDACTGLFPEEKELFLQNVGNKKDIKSIFQKLFIVCKNLWSDSDKILIDRYFESEFYEILKSNRDVFEKAADFQQSHSVDEMIQDNLPEAIRPRNTYYLELNDKEDFIWWDESNKIKEITVDFKDMLQSWKKYLLRSHIWQGKSFWLTEFIKYATSWDKEIVLFEASDFFNKRTSVIKKKFQEIEKRWAILCIDAIDEIIENKEEIKQFISDFQWSCIITARPSEYPDRTTGFTTLSLRPMNTDDFLWSRFQGQEEKLDRVRKILEDNQLDREVEWNPLLLTFVVLLAKVDEKKLKDIQSKADLYENVVRFILADHAKRIKKHIMVSEWELSAWMNDMWEYAYNIFSNKPQKDSVSKFNSHLSVLFKNIKKNQYEFIHKSFYEFFLARHLAYTETGNEGVSKYRDINYMDGRFFIANYMEWEQLAICYFQMLTTFKRPVTQKIYLEMISCANILIKWERFIDLLLVYKSIAITEFPSAVKILHKWAECLTFTEEYRLAKIVYKMIESIWTKQALLISREWLINLNEAQWSIERMIREAEAEINSDEDIE